MCFSAPVSFISSGVLATIGIGSRKIASKRNQLIATVPLIFGIQQAIEGILWLVDKPSTAANVIAYAFLFFAYLWWPTYIPIGVYLHEEKASRRSALVPFIMLGMFISSYLLFALLRLPLDVSVVGHHIYYHIEVPLTTIGAVLYVLVTAGSFFASSDRFFQFFGLLVVVSAVLAYWIESTTFTSVWCFFAALLSAISFVYLWIHREQPGKIWKTKKRH